MPRNDLFFVVMRWIYGLIKTKKAQQSCASTGDMKIGFVLVASQLCFDSFGGIVCLSFQASEGVAALILHAEFVCADYQIPRHKDHASE